jgi:phage-related protein
MPIPIAAIAALGEAVAGVGQTAGVAAGAMAEAGGAAKGAATALQASSGAAEGANSAIKASGASAQQLTGSLNSMNAQVDKISGAFQSLTNYFSQFTQYINPALVDNLNRAFRDMYAVVGIVASEFTAVLTPIVRDMASAMLPLARQIAPLIAQLASAMADRIGALITLFAKISDMFAIQISIIVELISKLTAPFLSLVGMLTEVATLFKPMLESFSTSMSAFGTVLQAIITILQAALLPIFMTLNAIMLPINIALKVFAGLLNLVLTPIQAVLELFSGVMNDIIRTITFVVEFIQNVVMGLLESFFAMFKGPGQAIGQSFTAIRTAIQDVIKTLILLAAQFLKMLGFTGALNALTKTAGGKKESADGLAVAQNPQFQSIESMGKSLVLSAFAASAEKTAGPAKTEDFLAGIQDQIKDIVSGKTNMFDDLMKKLGEKIKEWIPMIIQAVKGEAGKQIFGLAEEAAGAISSVAKKGAQLLR